VLVEAQLRGSLDRAIARQIERMRQRPIRSMRRFAEEEIIIPSGKYEDAHFRCDRQPFTAHWFDLIDSRRWNKHSATGPVQASKTLCCSTIPLCYHLFEIGETVVYAVPTGDMADDKWKTDILPVIKKSRYRDLLPDKGSGSRDGGNLTLIEFKNKARLRFMGAGGDDATRAGFTTRVVVMTEMDKFKVKSKNSKESNPFKQIQDRLMSWGEDSIFYGETTVSTKEGLVWQQWLKGTGTQVYIPCPYCKHFVLPERKDLRGWENATSIFAAKRDAKLYCPKCGEPWTEDDRRKANEEGIPLHRGQSIEDGVIVGEPPETDMMSFRWTAVHNHMSPMSVTAGEEWDSIYGAGAEDPDDSELTLRQKHWAMPPDPEEMSEPAEFKPFPLMRRMGERMTVEPHDKRIVPAWVERLTAGIDCKDSYLHYVVHGWGDGARSQIVDYGVEEVQTELLGRENAIRKAILTLSDKLTEGYPDEQGEIEYIERVFVDAGYLKNQVVDACLEILKRQKALKHPPGLAFNKRIYYPILGFGLSSDARKLYSKPRTEGPNVIQIGLGSYLGRVEEGDSPQTIYQIDVDYWKGWVRRRLACSADNPAAMTFWHTLEPKDHLSLAKHLCAEAPHTEFVPGKGYVKTWLRKNRNNHYLDATTYSSVAAWWTGVRLETPDPEDEQSSKTETKGSSNGTSNGTAPPPAETNKGSREKIRRIPFLPTRR
jgi:phage terminase large subunit GpA-like protein